MRTKGLAMVVMLGMWAAAVVGCSGGGYGSPSGPASGTTGTVTGSVKDNTGAGVSGASVQLSATGKTTKATSSGADGSYTFSNVPTGIWQVSVVAPAGYSGGSFPTITVSYGATATAEPIVLTKDVPGSTPTATNVVIYQSAFSPQSVTIKAGGTVTWRNNDDITHTATGAGFDTGALNTGQSSIKTFATPGTYTYACAIHSFMTGKVVVLQ